MRRVAHQQSLLGQGTDNAAGCALDVNCFPAWQDTKKSVAHIVFEETNGDETGTFLCSATLVSTRDNSFKPYLLTAGHCIHSEAAARSLQTYWSYESTGCNQGPPANKGTVIERLSRYLKVPAQQIAAFRQFTGPLAAQLDLLKNTNLALLE